MMVEPDPFFGIQERFGGEGPALQVESLLLASIALHHDVFVLANARRTFGRRHHDALEVMRKGSAGRILLHVGYAR
jgi:hypothetical protein